MNLRAELEILRLRRTLEIDVAACVGRIEGKLDALFSSRSETDASGPAAD